MKPKLQNARQFTLFILLLVITLLLNQAKLAAQEATQEDRTISPFFYVECKDSTIEQLPLLSTKVDVSIIGVIADVTIRQRYKNAGGSPIESKYIFPASTKAAVYNLKMIIGERILTAVIKEKEQAQHEYEEAVSHGYTATLLEQERPNVLQMRVGNIMPGDTIDVVLQYTELITPVEGIYEFVYPTVVGPRYFSPSTSEAKDSTWVEIPYTHQGEAPKSIFNINVQLDGGMPVSAIHSPSHESLEINYLNETLAECKLPESDSISGNRDFVLDYVLSGEKNKAGMLLYEGKDENFFLSMIQPPVSPTTEDINLREYIFILDVSGSMYGFPLETSKKLTSEIIRGLKQQEKFNILCFAGGSNFLFDESRIASPENVEKALDFISTLQGSGGTELLPALQKAISYPADNQFSRILLIATDGYVTVEKQAFDLIRNNLNKANFFAFGIGQDVNRYIIEGMAHAGMGEPFVVLKESDASQKAALFRRYVASPVLTKIKTSFNDISVSDIEPLSIPDVFSERPVLLFGKWVKPLQGSLTLEGISGNNLPYSKTLMFSDFTPSVKNKALSYLWARQRLQQLSDYSAGADSPETKASIIELGLKYNMVTEYTSFIAVDSIVRNVDGEVTTVVMPNPMPEGVSNLAIGNSYGATGMATEVMDVKQETFASKIQSAFPNPFVNQITLLIYLDKTDLNKDKTLDIFNALGEKIKSINISALNHTSNSYQLDAETVARLSVGIYFIQLRLDGTVAGSCKIVKK
ncbi:MAG TPA: VIT domain-containing protein [Prolixibacteraceae bacterium]|jgi:Ca-activated chloride channel family protein